MTKSIDQHINWLFQRSHAFVLKLIQEVRLGLQWIQQKYKDVQGKSNDNFNNK